MRTPPALEDLDAVPSRPWPASGRGSGTGRRCRVGRRLCVLSTGRSVRSSRNSRGADLGCRHHLRHADMPSLAQDRNEPIRSVSSLATIVSAAFRSRSPTHVLREPRSKQPDSRGRPPGPPGPLAVLRRMATEECGWRRAAGLADAVSGVDGAGHPSIAGVCSAVPAPPFAVRCGDPGRAVARHRSGKERHRCPCPPDPQRDRRVIHRGMSVQRRHRPRADGNPRPVASLRSCVSRSACRAIEAGGIEPRPVARRDRIMVCRTGRGHPVRPQGSTAGKHQPDDPPVANEGSPRRPRARLAFDGERRPIWLRAPASTAR